MPFHLAVEFGGVLNFQQRGGCVYLFSCLSLGYFCELGAMIGILAYTIILGIREGLLAPMADQPELCFICDHDQ